MTEKQTTINEPVSFSGKGLHTGKETTITFLPSAANSGYKFIRTDIQDRPEIPALVDYVVDLSRGTTLGIGDYKVHTVEHVLAALAGLRIDNCTIELNGIEPPVFDGSSIHYVEALQKAGIKTLDAEREYFFIDETIRYKNDAKQVEIVALPTDDFRITVMVDYFNPALGSQHTGLFDLEKEFVSEFAPARTFCFLKEVEALHQQGLIKGGNLESALVIVDKEMTNDEAENIKKIFNLDKIPEIGDNGYLDNKPLRYKNEPARHKLLDMIGDLTLAGVNVKAQILAARPGHASNIEFAKKIREAYLKSKKEKKNIDKSTKPELDIYELMEIMPHRYPFLMIDRITYLNHETKEVVGYKNVTINEPFFQGHFPGKPIMPGVLILEAMAQIGGLSLIEEIKAQGPKLALFMSINNAKFRKPVIPGDKLVLECKQTRKKFNTFSFSAVARVDGQIVAESELQAALVDREM